MKRLLLTLAILAIGTTAFAQATSTTQMQLVASAVFTSRLQYNGALVMKEVLEEPQSASASGEIPAYTAACHTRRGNFAREFLENPAQYASRTAVLVSSANFSGAVIVGTVTGEGAAADSAATDAAIQQAYRILMNTFAGCIINP